MSDTTFTTLPATITARWLRKTGACEEQVAAFKIAFPDGITKITAAVIRKAIDAGLRVGWFAQHNQPERTCLGCYGHKYPVKLARLYRSVQRPPKAARS